MALGELEDAFTDVLADKDVAFHQIVKDVAACGHAGTYVGIVTQGFDGADEAFGTGATDGHDDASSCEAVTAEHVNG